MSEEWKSFIVACFVKRTLELAIEECTGCQDSRLSPLLHVHQTTGLLKKLIIFFDRIKTELCSNIEQLLSQYQHRFNICDFELEYTEVALIFLKNLTPNTLYYGRYITIDNDLNIYGDAQVNAPIKKRKKRVHKGTAGS